jgi:hypothetical protein
MLTEKVMIADFFKDFFTAAGTQPAAFTRKVQTKMPEFKYGEGSSVLTGRQLEDVTVAPRQTAEAPLADEGVVSLPQRGLADATLPAQYMPEGLDAETPKGQKGGMNKKDLTQSLLDAGFTANEYDSTNAWGYAGSKGVKYVKENAEVLVANAYTRGGKAFDTSFVTVTFKGPSPVKKVAGRVHDDLQDKKSFERVARILKIEGLLN